MEYDKALLKRLQYSTNRVIHFELITHGAKMKQTKWTCDGCGISEDAAPKTTISYSAKDTPDDWKSFHIDLNEMDFCPRCYHDFKALVKKFTTDKKNKSTG